MFFFGCVWLVFFRDGVRNGVKKGDGLGILRGSYLLKWGVGFLVISFSKGFFVFFFVL